jgi:uncharacterized membrane protein
MPRTVRDLAEELLKTGYGDLSPSEQEVLRRIEARAAISRDIDAASSASLTFGERLADRVASFGGSWTFLILFVGLIASWVAVNAALLARPPDPYPFILLNLVLSMIAAVQAPIIMMSQNRQSANDRLTMQHDYEVNLKAELEILSLHEKVDDLRMRQLEEQFARIEAQIAAIASAIGATTGEAAKRPRA